MLIFILEVIINYGVAGTPLAACLQWLSGKTKQLLGRYCRKAPRVLPSCFLLLAQVEIFMHREGNKGHASRLLSGCLLRKHCFFGQSSKHATAEIWYRYTHRVVSICQLLPSGRWNQILSEHHYQLRCSFVFSKYLGTVDGVSNDSF